MSKSLILSLLISFLLSVLSAFAQEVTADSTEVVEAPKRVATTPT